MVGLLSRRTSPRGRSAPVRLPRSPESRSSATTRSRVVWAVVPASSAYAARPASSSNPGDGSKIRRPSHLTIVRVSSASSRHHVTSLRSPNVHTMAIPEPFSGSANLCDTTGTLTLNSGQHGLPEQRLVSLVIGMRDQRHARRKQFRPRRGNGYPSTVSAVKRNVVISGRPVTIFELCLGNSGPEGDVPASRCFSLIRFSTGKIVCRNARCEIVTRSRQWSDTSWSGRSKARADDKLPRMPAHLWQ